MKRICKLSTGAVPMTVPTAPPSALVSSRKGRSPGEHAAGSAIVDSVGKLRTSWGVSVAVAWRRYQCVTRARRIVELTSNPNGALGFGAKFALLTYASCCVVGAGSPNEVGTTYAALRKSPMMRGGKIFITSMA